jgi:hypothetical protein
MEGPISSFLYVLARVAQNTIANYDTIGQNKHSISIAPISKKIPISIFLLANRIQIYCTVIFPNSIITIVFGAQEG